MSEDDLQLFSQSILVLSSFIHRKLLLWLQLIKKKWTFSEVKCCLNASGHTTVYLNTVQCKIGQIKVSITEDQTRFYVTVQT